jgi:hypothetical protein
VSPRLERRARRTDPSPARAVATRHNRRPWIDVRSEIGTAVAKQTKWATTVLMDWSALLVTAVRVDPGGRSRHRGTTFEVPSLRWVAGEGETHVRTLRSQRVAGSHEELSPKRGMKQEGRIETVEAVEAVEHRYTGVRGSAGTPARPRRPTSTSRDRRTREVGAGRAISRAHRSAAHAHDTVKLSDRSSPLANVK